jgi:hypothetical protein
LTTQVGAAQLPATMAAGNRGPGEELETLRHVLASSVHLANDIAADPLLGRLLDVFARMPAEDRATVLDVLEREVDLRVLTQDGARRAISGIALVQPNPSARLYFRVAENEPGAPMTPEEVAHAVMRGARVVHRAFGAEARAAATWEPAIVGALARMTPDERASLRWFHTRMIELVDAAER